MENKNHLSYDALLAQALEVLNALEKDSVSVDVLSQKLSEAYDIIDKLKQKLSENEAKVIAIIDGR